MSYLIDKDHDVKKEKEKLAKVLKERVALEELLKHDKNHIALRKELSETDRREVLHPINGKGEKVKYIADGRSYFDRSRYMMDTSDLGPKYDVTEMLESEKLVLRVMKELDERKKLMKTPIAELYKDTVSDEPPNKYFAIRKMGEFLEEEEFTAEEIAMLRTLMKKIVKKHKGSKEELLLSLYIEEKL